MSDIKDTPLGIWTCKIGEAGVNPAHGLDSPMRKAVAKAYHEITGVGPDFIFSGWRGSLTEAERAVVEYRLPDEDKAAVEVTRKELDALRESARLLEALETYGVDNWEGYSDALRYFDGEDPDQ